MAEYLFGVVAKILDCNILVSNLELQSYYFVHFWKITQL